MNTTSNIFRTIVFCFCLVSLTSAVEAQDVRDTIGIRAIDDERIVFVKCALNVEDQTATGCVDISHTWQVQAFTNYLQNELASAEMNSWLKTGMLTALGGAGAWGGWKVLRSFRSMPSAYGDAARTIARNGGYSSPGSVSRTLETGLIGLTIVADVARVLSLPFLASTVLTSIGYGGAEIYWLLTAPDVEAIPGLVKNATSGERIFIFESKELSRIPIGEQEQHLQLLLSLMFQEIGA